MGWFVPEQGLITEYLLMEKKPGSKLVFEFKEGHAKATGERCSHLQTLKGWC